jgi:acyl-CoA synthetase (AMP-forming)/AMP-acid ligase II/peptidoglycan/LPS O-acetylase OafA/YrhL
MEPARALANQYAASGLSGARTYAATLENFADRPAVLCEDGRTLSYRQLAVEADAFAAQLGPQRRLLVIEARNALEPLVALIGALRAGHVVLLLPGSGPPPRRSAAETGKSSHGEAGAGRLLERYAPDAAFSETAAGWRLQIHGAPDCALNPDLAMLSPTSGTTGAAKLVRLSYGAIAANAAAIADYLGIAPSDAAVTALPMHYCYGLSVIASHLSCGARVLLTDRSVVEPEFWSFAEAHGVTNLAGVPYTFELLERIGLREKPPATLRTLTQAGGRLPPELAHAYARWAQDNGMQMFVMYGQTEATARMAYVPPERLLESPGAIGVPIPGGAIALRADDGAEVRACDTPGEIIYTGPNVMMGYAEDRADLAKGAVLKELATGDLARRGQDGLYYIVGRKSRFCKLFGIRVSLDEIEAALARDGLKAHVTGDDSLIAVAGAGLPPGLPQVLGTRYGLPSSSFAVVAVEEPPTLPSGKIDYGRIMSMAKATAAPAAPAGAETVAEVFQRVFEGRVLKGQDSFSSLGGDSLSYVTLSLGVEEALGYLPEDWQDITLARYAEMQTAPARSRRSRSWLETDVLLRAAAILAVVTHHATNLPMQGGALVLMVLAGFNMARFQREGLAAGKGFDLMRAMALNQILPAYVLSLLWQIHARDVSVAALLFATNFQGDFSSVLEAFWFLQALFQCRLIYAALFSLGPLRKWARTAPWRLGLALLACFLALRYAAVLIFHHQALANRTPDAVLYALALGWTLQQTRTVPQRVMLSCIALALAALNLIAPWRYGSVNDTTEAAALACACLLILWVRGVTLPHVAKVAVTLVAAASYYIYLVHWPVLAVLNHQIGVSSAFAGVAGAVAVGLMAWQAAALLRRRMAGLRAIYRPRAA